MNKYSVFLFTTLLAFSLPVYGQAAKPGGGGGAPGGVKKEPAGKPAGEAGPTPFEPTPGELITEEIKESELTEDEKRMRKRNLRAEELWKNADYRDYTKSFALLHQLSRAFANNKYRLALSSYQSGVNTIIKMRDKIQLFRKEADEAKHLNEKWYWQIVDRKAREERYMRRLQEQAKLEAVTYFTRAINHLDEIKNADLREKPAFKKLLSSIYRNWIMYQFDLGNLPQTIQVLELYIQIDENEKEYPAHKYLAQAYAFQERIIDKFKVGTEDQKFRFRYKKNVHLLRAAELKYGKESAEYKAVVNNVNKDEIISVQP